MPKKEAHHHKKPVKKNSISAKLIVLFVIILASYMIYLQKDKAIELMKQNPLIWNAYSFAEWHISQQTIIGIFLVIFVSALFFTPLPTEILFIYYLSSPNNPIVLLTITIIGNTAGLVFNYLCGFVVGKPVLGFFLEKSLPKLEKWNKRFGGMIIFIGNVAFLPIQIFSLIIGGLRYNLNKFIFYCVLGQLVKYTAIIFAKDYLMANIIPYLQGIL